MSSGLDKTAPPPSTTSSVDPTTAVCRAYAFDERTCGCRGMAKRGCRGGDKGGGRGQQGNRPSVGFASVATHTQIESFGVSTARVRRSRHGAFRRCHPRESPRGDEGRPCRSPARTMQPETLETCVQRPLSNAQVRPAGPFRRCRRRHSPRPSHSGRSMSSARFRVSVRTSCQLNHPPRSSHPTARPLRHCDRQPRRLLEERSPSGCRDERRHHGPALAG